MKTKQFSKSTEILYIELKIISPRLVFYPQPIEEWSSLSHDGGIRPGMTLNQFTSCNVKSADTIYNIAYIIMSTAKGKYNCVLTFDVRCQ